MVRRAPRYTLFPTRRSSDLLRRRLAEAELEDARQRAGDVGHRTSVVRIVDLDRAHTAVLLQGGAVEPRHHLAVAHELEDRKSTRLNSSHVRISYAVFCLKTI